jgi:DNA polymerase/3'-5' exonuclease PolX
MAEEHSLWNETWRVQSYRKAVATLRRQSKKIETAQEAEALTNIGGSLAGHIEEIVSTGRFQKLEQIRSEPERRALKIFCSVYGVGVSTAKKWVELGYRTLNDLQSKANLSVNQKIGVERYDDLLTRIPRAEVKALGDFVKEVAADIDSSVELIIGGSYRRGADSSGDIDIIVTKGGTSSTHELGPFFDKLVKALTKAGFLTAALASHRHDEGNKWHGCCVLPEAAFPGLVDNYRPIWRRIDFLLVPETEIGAALIYFTGNDLFNRSMRLLAGKKKMKLNHKALSGAGIHEGRDERKIFEILGVKWREPHERWC